LGIIKKIKDMFSKNIDCSDILQDKLFHLYTIKNRTITVGANIIVPEGYTAIFVCRDKITDIIPEGKFAIAGINMPKTFKKMRLSKADRKGNFPKKFVADLYYICKKDVKGIRFSSYNAYKSKCKKLGGIKAHSEGTFNIKITEPEKLLKYMLTDRAYITDELFLDLIGGIVGDYVNNTLASSEYTFIDLISNTAIAYKYINEQLENNNYFDFLGFSINNVKIEFMKVNSKLQRKIEQEISIQSDFVSDVNKSYETNINIPSPNINKGEVVSEIKIEKSFEPMGDIGYKTCPKCNQKINRTARFCERCGMDLTNF